MLRVQAGGRAGDELPDERPRPQRAAVQGPRRAVRAGLQHYAGLLPRAGADEEGVRQGRVLQHGRHRDHPAELLAEDRGPQEELLQAGAGRVRCGGEAGDHLRRVAVHRADLRARRLAAKLFGGDDCAGEGLRDEVGEGREGAGGQELQGGVRERGAARRDPGRLEAVVHERGSARLRAHPEVHGGQRGMVGGQRHADADVQAGAQAAAEALLCGD